MSDTSHDGDGRGNDWREVSDSELVQLLAAQRTLKEVAPNSRTPVNGALLSKKWQERLREEYQRNIEEYAARYGVEVQP